MFPPQDWIEALEAARGLKPTANAVQRLTSQFGDEAARWALEQWELRQRGASKFVLSEQMLFDRDGLEMATNERVASWRAGRFPAKAKVVDMTAGIGGDLIALARRGPTLGMECDPKRADLARWNLRVHGLEAEVIAGDTADPSFEYAFADPTRRTSRGRTVDPEAFLPNPATLADAMANCKVGAIKLSPMLSDDYLDSLAKRLEFVSFGRECREALVWLGSEIQPGRFAVQVETGEFLPAREIEDYVFEAEGYLYDADPAAVRAHALGELCQRHGLAALGDSNGYLVGPALIESPWLRAYRVLYDGKADLKTTQKALGDLEGRIIEVKLRGVPAQEANLIKKLKVRGQRRVSLVVWPFGKSLRHTLVEPV